MDSNMISWTRRYRSALLFWSKRARGHIRTTDWRMRFKDGRARRAISDERLDQGKWNDGALRQTRRQCFLASLLMRVSLGQAGYARDGYIGYAVLFPSGRPSGASMKLWRGTRLIGIHGNEMEPSRATGTRETGFWKIVLTCGAGVAVQEWGTAAWRMTMRHSPDNQKQPACDAQPPNTDGTRAWKHHKLLAVSGR
jgi:hypothetical protein